MRRFWSDLNTLAGLSRVNRKRTALGVLLAYLILNQYWGFQLFKADGAGPAPIEGPMAPYRVQEASAPAPCRAPACTFDGGPARLVRQRTVLPLALELPALEEFRAPPGTLMVPEAAHAAPWLTYDPFGGNGHKLEMMYVPRGQAAAPQADERQRVLVPWEGLVAEALVAGSGKRVLSTGQVLDAQGRPTELEPLPAFELLRIQPLPQLVRARGEGPWPTTPEKGNEFQLLVRWPDNNLIDAEIQTWIATSLRASVHGVDAADPKQPRVELSIGWTRPANADLARIAPGQLAAGQPLLPTRVGLVDLRARIVDLHAVPVSAVVHDDRGDRVWVAMDGFAVPVTVRVQSLREDRAWVAELPQERNRPVRAADWRALGVHARAAVYRARQPGTPGADALLAAQGVSVLLRPDAGLRPGQAVAVRGGSGA